VLHQVLSLYNFNHLTKALASAQITYYNNKLRLNVKNDNNNKNNDNNNIINSKNDNNNINDKNNINILTITKFAMDETTKSDP
jgi:hypothetical protein